MEDSDALIVAMLAAEDQLSNPYFDDTNDYNPKSDEEDYNPLDYTTSRPKNKLKSAKLLKKVGKKST